MTRMGQQQHVAITKNSKYAIAAKESQQVLHQRKLVMVVLTLAAFLICCVVFVITSRAEDKEFGVHFQGGAEKIAITFERTIVEKFGAVGSLCLAVTAAGKTGEKAQESPTGDTWPYVTMDSFQERASSARILSDVLHMSVIPMVTEEERETWEQYSVENADWYAEGFSYQEALIENGFRVGGLRNRNLQVAQHGRTRILQESENQTDFDLFVPFIYQYTEYWEIVPPPPENVPYAPIWQSSPVTKLDGINLNFRTFAEARRGYDIATTEGEVVVQGFVVSEPGDTTSPNFLSAWHAELLSTKAGKPIFYNGDPLGEIAYPIFSDFEGDRRVVGAMTAQFSWKMYFEHILPENARGFILVLTNECDGSYTYRADGETATMMGPGDLHDERYEQLRVSTAWGEDVVVQDGSRSGVRLNQRGCPYSLHVYPSEEMWDAYHTKMPFVITLCIFLIFVVTAGTFLFYDRLVERRQHLVETTAKQSTDIIGSLFPEAIRDRLLQNEAQEYLSANQRVKLFLSGGSDKPGERPIADLFPHTTVMFADIAGFTAWSSLRDPSQVFALLQAVYGSFDEIARALGVFKVETIGDCYVAVAGLPNPQPDHAVIMAKFAWECKTKLVGLLKDLARTLGPATNELTMRFGLHSGAVTAGVLRGDRARFQLFGDTVNTAARIESTGVPGKIQVSHTTAHLLHAAGKASWLKRREDDVVAKGKGVLNTFFCYVSDEGIRRSSLDSLTDPATEQSKKKFLLVQWMTDLLVARLREIVAKRQNGQSKNRRNVPFKDRTSSVETESETIPLDALAEVIELPEFSDQTVSHQDPSEVVIPDKVVEQLKSHVAAVAATYRTNPFHNFEHACHVAMASTKLLGRIVAPEIDLVTLEKETAVASRIHDYTHGICSDPLTLFGIVYSALIHDADHFGVGNAQTIKEDPGLGDKYRGKSVAEQNSFDTAWNLLMVDELSDLRRCLFGNDHSEMVRFRQVVINIVLATDIFDKELNDLRKRRWVKAFDQSGGAADNNLRGTIVLEHIIQASDVSHTMQHWHVYQKWNRLLFREMRNAFHAGRMAVDPATFWYKGEIGFFDNYVIPLAKKLKDCGVFGVSSDECLTYALQNRAEWEARGLAIVEDLIAEVDDKTSSEDENLASGELYV